MSVNWQLIALTLVILFVFGSAYSLVVRLIARRGIEGQTAYLVVLGSGITILGSAFLIGWVHALLVLACFGASGLPMVIEYVLRVSNEQRRDKEDAKAVARDLL